MPREMPPVDQVLDACREGMRGYHSAAPFESVRLAVQRQLRCSPRNARDWMKRALTDPGQTRLVWLVSSEDKYVQRIERDDLDPADYAYSAITNGGHVLWLHLDRQGMRCPSAAGVRNQAWVMLRSVFDAYVQQLVAEDREKQERRARLEVEAEAETEDIIGTELSLIRGMLAAAGIELGREGGTQMNAVAVRRDREGKSQIRAWTTLEVRGRDLRRLAKWLQDKGVEPVGPPTPQAAPEAEAEAVQGA